MCIWVLVFMTVSATSLRITKRESPDNSMLEYLSAFGYLDRPADGAAALRTEQSVRDALRAMQKFAGIPATGRQDAATLKLLRTPRCGLPDRPTGEFLRVKRYVTQGQKWPYHNLTWSLRNFHSNNISQNEVRRVIKKSLDVWAKESLLTFTEVDSDRADILIYFYKRYHGDNFPFDGAGMVLAHAFFPNGGSTVEVHFDADEAWTTSANSDDGTNMFNVAAHEFGHSLGLQHSTDSDALMHPWYKDIDNINNYALPVDDRNGIQFLYGRRERFDRIPTRWTSHPRPAWPPRTTTPSTTTTSTQRPRTTATRSRARHPNHRHYTPMPPKKVPPSYAPPSWPDKRWYEDAARNHPRPVDEAGKEGENVPDTCGTSFDAVSIIRREVFFFKDKYLWRIGENNKLLPNYPAEIRRLWSQLPDGLTHVDAVYERPDNRIVFFIGQKYYVFRGHMLEAGYPRRITNLGLPDSLEKINGAMVWGHNGRTYFFSGNLYWRFDEEVGKVELDYPRDISMFKGVGTDIDAVFQWRDSRTYFFKGKGFWKFDDARMRVEKVEQMPSAPFWMGCSVNLEGNDVLKKLPLLKEPEMNGANVLQAAGASLVAFLAVICVFLR